MHNKWKSCLQLIRQKLNNDQLYKVWFADITIDSYDAEKNAVVLRVPSRYVCEYIEQYQIKILSWALTSSFGPGVRLNYRIGREPSFSEVVDILKQQGLNAGSTIPHITIPDARKRMEDGLRHFVGDNYQWLPAYDKVADWLTDNKGRGLLCFGDSGLGKTLLCTQILPVIFGRNIPVVTAQEMNQRIDSLLKEKVIIIDDLGKEDVEIKNYGNRRTPFFELCDAAERQGKMLIITSNLPTLPLPQKTPDRQISIQERYGIAVIDRLRAITRAIRFDGPSLRG